MVKLEELIEKKQNDPDWELSISRGVFAERKKSARKKRIIAATLGCLLLVIGTGAFLTLNREETLQTNLESVISETLPHYTSGVVISKDIDTQIDQFCMVVEK